MATKITRINFENYKNLLEKIIWKKYLEIVFRKVILNYLFLKPEF
jgi:hypothetical protein